MAMGKISFQADAPSRSGITGIYKLLIKGEIPKFSSYEYKLEDAEEKVYKAVRKKHFAEDNIRDFLIEDRAMHGADTIEGEWIQFENERFPD